MLNEKVDDKELGGILLQMASLQLSGSCQWSLKTAEGMDAVMNITKASGNYLHSGWVKKDSLLHSLRLHAQPPWSTSISTQATRWQTILP